MNLEAMTSIFSSIFLAELGDKTQLATLCLCCTLQDRISRLGVFLAASSALVLATGLGVAAGQVFGLFAKPDFLKAGAGLIFIILGLILLREGFRDRGSRPPCV